MDDDALESIEEISLDLAGMSTRAPDPPEEPRPRFSDAPAAAAAAAAAAEEEEEQQQEEPAALEEQQQPPSRERRRERAWVRRTCSLWVPADRLHRLNDEWVLVVDRSGARSFLPVESVGRAALPAWAARLVRACCCCCCCGDGGGGHGGHHSGQASEEAGAQHEGSERRKPPAKLFVRFNGADVPRFIARRSAARLQACLRRGGPLKTGRARFFGKRPCLLMFAWGYNLVVLLASSLFLIYAWLIVLDRARSEFTVAVMNTYVASLALSFLCNDIAVCAVVALLPVASKKPHRYLNWLATIILAIVGPDDD